MHTSKTVMMTLPRERESIEEVYLLQFFLKNDIHKWIIAKETGNDGYKHWQIRFQWRGTFQGLKELFPKAHIEEDAQNDYTYEKKDGEYLSSDDGIGQLQTRFGSLRTNQKRILANLDEQNDREIDVIIDPYGNTGKTWLARYLYQRGRGFYVPPTITDARTLIQYVANGYDKEPYVVIDIARSTKWTNALYVAVETIKDGLIYDARYKTTVRDIHGVKVLVTCNESPVLKKLSRDRWRLFDSEGAPLS